MQLVITSHRLLLLTNFSICSLSAVYYNITGTSCFVVELAHNNNDLVLSNTIKHSHNGWPLLTHGPTHSTNYYIRTPQVELGLNCTA